MNQSVEAPQVRLLPRAAPPSRWSRVTSTLTRALPRVRGAGLLAKPLKSMSARSKRGEPFVEADVHGMRMRLDMREFLDRELFFIPHLYDRHTVEFVSKTLHPGDVFLDAGANIGLFTLVAARAVGSTGRVVAVDADPDMHAILAHNVALNEFANVTTVNKGLSEASGSLAFHKGPEGFRGCGTFLQHTEDAGQVTPVVTLAALMESTGVKRFRGMKFDIEGFENRVLVKFFDEVPEEAWPEFVVVEALPHFFEKAGGNVVELLKSKGFKVKWSHEADHIMVRE